MESSFTGEAARDRYCGDHSSHTLITGGAGSRIPRARNITPSSATRPSGAKRSFAVGMQAAWFFDRRRAIDRQRANERLAGDSTKAAASPRFRHAFGRLPTIATVFPRLK